MKSWNIFFYVRCFIVLLQFAVVGVIVFLHPLLDLWVALPAGGEERQGLYTPVYSLLVPHSQVTPTFTVWE